MIKVRLQLQDNSGGQLKYKGFFRSFLTILKEEGPVGFSRGLAPALLRDGSYSAIRLGLYDTIRAKYILKIDKDGKKHGEETLWKKITAGLISGSVGSGEFWPSSLQAPFNPSSHKRSTSTALCSPTDLIKVQMQASTPDGRPIYSSMRVAVATVVAQSGVKGLWAGVWPNVVRAAGVTASQLPSYDHSKHLLFQTGWSWVEEGMPLHIVCSMIAGVVSATVTSPADVIKSRIMNDHAKVYSSAMDCLIKTVRNEGFMTLYAGWVPNWSRLGPHSLITFLVLEQLRRLAGVSPV